MPSSQKTRILLLGDARQVHLHRWARYLGDTGFDVLTVSLEPVVDILGPRERIHIPRYLPGIVRYPLAAPVVRRIIRTFDPAVVNAHFLPNYGVIAMLAGFHPWVLSTWGSDIMRLPQRSPFHLARTRRVIASADAITSDADVMSRRIAELGADPQRIVTFPYGVDRAVFHPVAGPGSGPAHQSDNRSAPRIVSNRRLESVYNVETVIAAFAAVLRRVRGAVLTVAGEGALEHELRGMAARLVPVEFVRFVGAVRHDDMAPLLRAHDIYVSMSLSDTTSVSLLEAMACGLFPIVSDIPANREWIEHGKNGVLVAARDAVTLTEAIIAAWEDAALRERAADLNARIVAERADWYDNMRAAGDLFSRLASAGSTRGKPA